MYGQLWNYGTHALFIYGEEFWTGLHVCPQCFQAHYHGMAADLIGWLVGWGLHYFYLSITRR